MSKLSRAIDSMKRWHRVCACVLFAGALSLFASSMAIAPDTDGDGIPDDVEVIEGCNPNVQVKGE